MNSRILYLLLVAISLPGLSFAQKIEENKIDESTKRPVIRTTWEPFIRNIKGYSFVRVSKVDESTYLDLKYTHVGAFKFIINEGKHVILRLKNDSLVLLNVGSTVPSCRGCGNNTITMGSDQGVHLPLLLQPDQIDNLSVTPAVAIRIYTVDGYIEADIKEKDGDMIAKQLKLVQQK
jgi:hypothetical protein